MEKKTEKIAEEKLEKQELKAEELDQVVGGSFILAKGRCPRCGGLPDRRGTCDCGRNN